MPGFELIGEEERAQINEVFDNGSVLFRSGFHERRNNIYKVREFEERFSKVVGAEYCLAVTSGTAALRVALAAIGVGIGDEVITQAFTFVATVEAIIESGANPVCVEIDETLNMDPNSLEVAITEKTKAVIVVHMLGVPADMNRICEICRKRKIKLIEDTAWGLGASIDGQKLGTIGDIGTFSFDYAKAITTGEGGMITFRDNDNYRRAVAWHDHGHENNPMLQRWEDSRQCSGFNYRMMELQGAIGIAQLNKLDKVINYQRDMHAKLTKIVDLVDEVELRKILPGSQISADAFVFMTTSNEKAMEIREALVSHGVATKILPEAIKWHFAGLWEHIPEVIAKGKMNNEKAPYASSRELLERAVAIPLNLINMVDLENTLLDCLKSVFSNHKQ